jgi:hypothetical protein
MSGELLCTPSPGGGEGQEGITSKDPAVVATILAQREAGMPPSTIGRTFRIHHTTVGRILSAVEEAPARDRRGGSLPSRSSRVTFHHAEIGSRARPPDGTSASTARIRGDYIGGSRRANWFITADANRPNG